MWQTHWSRRAGGTFSKFSPLASVSVHKSLSRIVCVTVRWLIFSTWMNAGYLHHGPRLSAVNAACMMQGREVKQHVNLCMQARGGIAHQSACLCQDGSESSSSLII